jgi:hypothetical protein
MAITEEQAMGVLDFKLPQMDIGVLDTLVEYLYEGRPGSHEVSLHLTPEFLRAAVLIHCRSVQQKLAEQILTEFQKHAEAWTRVHQILQESGSSNTKVEWYGSYECVL